jgi:hypothetical protein
VASFKHTSMKPIASMTCVPLRPLLTNKPRAYHLAEIYGGRGRLFIGETDAMWVFFYTITR